MLSHLFSQCHVSCVSSCVQGENLPPLLYHHTKLKAVPSILSRGLLPGGLRHGRLCVEFSLVPPLGDHLCKYGRFHETPALVAVNVADATRQGVSFYRSEAGAIFAPQGVPANCIVTVTNLASKVILFEFQEVEDSDEQATKRRKCCTSESSTALHLLPGKPVACVRCRALLPVGTPLCPNCMLRPLEATGVAHVEGQADADAYRAATIALARRFGLDVKDDDVKAPGWGRRGRRADKTQHEKRNARAERRGRRQTPAT